MNKPTKATRTKSPSASKPYAEAGDVTLTLRLPNELLAKIDAKVETLNAKKMGRWSRNALLVHLLETATEEPRGGK